VGPPAWSPGTVLAHELTPFQQVLLGTDGTVLHLLEVYTGEPIEAVKLGQELTEAPEDDTDAQVAAGTPVLRRKVLLRGAHTGRHLIHAEVVVVAGRLPAGLLDALLTTEVPIGALLRRHELESRREVLRVWREPAGSRASYFTLDPGDPMLARTYVILARRRPIMVISERFPAGAFHTLPATSIPAVGG